ncbi:MAG: YicC/YloC family endoribonuclease [Acidiferrobacterales bacterium]
MGIGKITDSSIDMIHSMTAFGRDQAQSTGGSLTWELRTVNHRYLDISLRLPEELRQIEMDVRKRIARGLDRGKVDGVLKFQRDAETIEINVDSIIVDRLMAAADKIQKQAGALPAISTAEILQWPGVMKPSQLDVSSLASDALDGLDRALSELVQTRSREGADLAGHIEQRLIATEKIVAEVKSIVPEVREAYHDRLRERLGEIQQELEPARLEQEMVIFANKIDIAEEVDRLATHIVEVRRIIAKGGAVGRRLDFLMQEFNRETNTIGSKANDIRTTKASIELKVLIEQMREQVQNIE